MSFVEIAKLNEKETTKGFKGRALHTGTMTLMFWDVEAGSISALHSHPHEQVATVIKGEFELTIDGVTEVLEPGRVALIPAHAVHGGSAITDCQLLDIFLPEREDYKF